MNYNRILSAYKNYLSCRESQPYYEPKVSRMPYSYTQGAFTFLYVEIGKQEMENKIQEKLKLTKLTTKNRFILD